MAPNEPPGNWHADDQRLYARVADAVSAAVQRGDLPALTPQAPTLARQLHQLLMSERAVSDEAHTRLAGWIASACMGSHHLWQDLGVQARSEVSRLLSLAFPALFASNTHHLRWKRHLFLCLGHQLGQPDLRPPKCDGCGDFDACMSAIPRQPVHEK